MNNNNNNNNNNNTGVSENNWRALENYRKSRMPVGVSAEYRTAHY
jgi:hypothetical protein